MDGRNGATVTGLLYDAMADPTACAALLDAISRRRQFKGSSGELAGVHTRAFRDLRGPADAPMGASLIRGEQSNTSVIYGDRLVLKLIRKIADGVNPDIEIGRFLTERTRFAYTAAVAGALEYRVGQDEPMTMAILHQFVPNQGTPGATPGRRYGATSTAPSRSTRRASASRSPIIPCST